ncbi:MAG: hypothetical protein WA814_12415 [Candidatus Baltobacteraceae bacterium]
MEGEAIAIRVFGEAHRTRWKIIGIADVDAVAHELLASCGNVVDFEIYSSARSRFVAGRVGVDRKNARANVKFGISVAKHFARLQAQDVPVKSDRFGDIADGISDEGNIVYHRMILSVRRWRALWAGFRP